MIFSSTHAVDCPYQYPEAIKTAFQWIADNDVANMEAGTYEVQGRDIYVMIQDITTQPAEVRRAERHDLYLDIQYIVSGTERMGYVPYTGKEEILDNPENKDVVHYTNLENETFVDVPAGSYCIFFSNDIHRPGCAAGEPMAVRKAVIKIKEAIL
ncbi:MAG: YhcH/YjgK/YiaL family protein [bacterium]|nr:YhcH/YjgK/YiaL family protein [bacterium]